MKFKPGDTVVYPNHGAGRICGLVEQECNGELRLYYSIHILHNDTSVMIPVDAARKAGIRPVISEPEVEEVIGVLRDGATGMPQDWSRRVKHNLEKIKSGDVLAVADVVRNLALRDHEKGLSTGEKQMFGTVKRILASELMYAKKMAEDEAIRFLDAILAEVCARPRCAG